MKSTFPSITIVTSTLNPEIATFTKVLKSIKNQKYEGRIEHIILDGGTTNDALKIAKKYGCTILSFKNSIDEGGNRLYTGLQKARGELILVLQSDNIIPHSNWLEKMVQPFSDKRIFSTYPAYNSYTSDMSLLTKYTALFGAPEPTLFYLNKSDKSPLFKKKYDKGKIVNEKKDYYIVQFNKYTLPTVGDNGYLIKKSALKKVVYKNRSYIHLDAFMELLEIGYDTYGVVKDSIIHVTHAKIINLIKRRVQVKTNFYDRKRGQRKYLVYNPNLLQDRINLIKYIVYSLTFVVPFFEALRGYMRIREKAWFLHPVMCFLMVVGYGVSEIRWYVKKGLVDGL